jgi:hypothetical protein
MKIATSNRVIETIDRDEEGLVDVYLTVSNGPRVLLRWADTRFLYTVIRDVLDGKYDASYQGEYT